MKFTVIGKVSKECFNERVKKRMLKPVCTCTTTKKKDVKTLPYCCCLVFCPFISLA